MIETRPIEIAFDAKQKVTGLEIVTGLDAADELGDAAIKIVAGNIQAAVGPCTAEVGAHIKSGPIVGRRGDWSFVGQGFGGQIRCKRSRAEQSDNSNARQQKCFHERPQNPGRAVSKTESLSCK